MEECIIIEENYLTCEFLLPYIVQPEGNNNFNYRDKIYRIIINHQISPVLKSILTGIHPDHVHSTNIMGPKEIFQGISKITLSIPISSQRDITYIIDKELRNEIVEVLNEYQYRYLYISKKYWLNTISANHFVNMNIISKKRKGFSSDWGGSHNNTPTYRRDDDMLLDFSKFIAENKGLPIQHRFLIDAKRHYLTGECHLMYVEIVIAFEAIVNKSYNKIFPVYEKKMFKEGKLQGKMAHLLKQYCGWKDEDIKDIIEMCGRRRQVIHDNKRTFSYKEAYSHLILGEKAILDITNWISN